MTHFGSYDDAPRPLTDNERRLLKRVFSDFAEVPGEWKTQLKLDFERDPPILGLQVLGGAAITVQPNSVLNVHVSAGAGIELEKLASLGQIGASGFELALLALLLHDMDLEVYNGASLVWALRSDGTLVGTVPVANVSGLGTSATRNVGTAAGEVAAGNDSRFVPTPRTAEAFLAAPQAISSAAYADLTGCSVTLAAGTWLILAEMDMSAANLAFLGHLAITDNAGTIVKEGSQGVAASGTAGVHQWAHIGMSKIVTPGATTTYKLRAARGNTTLTNTFTAQDGAGVGVANNDSDGTDLGTGIRAIRVA